MRTQVLRWAAAFAAAVCFGFSAAAEPWFRAEKVRCIAYLEPTEFMVESVPRVREMGFNCALASLGEQAPESMLPLIAAADRAGLHLIMVSYFYTEKYLAQSGDPRRYVGADGLVAPRWPCPTDARYWQATLANPALALARLRAAGHPSVWGLLLDMEDYANLGGSACGSNLYCYCDDCFGAFLRSVGASEAAPPAPQRASWLEARHLAARYRAFQDDAVVAIFADLRRQLDAIAPDFVLACYPWPYVEPARRDSIVAWDIRFARGLGSEAAPFIILDEATYTWGYAPHMERQSADLVAQGLHFLAVSGFNVVPAERVWYPEQMAANAYWACRRSDGYWIFLGTWPLLQVARGEHPSWLAMFGGRPEEWAQQFTAINHAIAANETIATAPLTLPPIENYWELSDLFGPRHAPGAELYVRRFRDIGLPWEGGELVLVGAKQGDWFSFERPERASDRYEISAWMTYGPDRGIAQLYADDQPVGAPVDLYAPVAAPGDRVVLGYIDLVGGAHTWRFVAVGKNGRSRGYDIGFRAIRMEEIGYFPQAWSVIGPFDNSGEELPGYDAVYPPEREIDLSATYAGKGGQAVRWRQINTNPDGFLNLLPHFAEPKDMVAYCLTYVYSPSDGPRTIMLGSDDGGKLFVNGEFVWGEAVARAAERDQNEPRAHFRRGWNAVLFKLLQTRGEWGLYLRVQDPQRELRYAPTPPQ